jgi:protoheme IX farnesyltransferase
MALVIFTSWVGLYLAPTHLPPIKALIAMLCIATGAGAAGALNMWWERHSDGLMKRTRQRPLPAGRLQPTPALLFAVALAIASVAVMAFAINALAAGLLALTIVFYVGIYTIWLKPRTPQNIVIGGAAGALPPVIGWAAATGQTALLPWLLFLLIFVWTPPHFWALAINLRQDYAKAGTPMLPVVAGLPHTVRQIWFYSLLCVAVSLLPPLFGLTGWLYAATAIGLGGWFARSCWRLYQVDTTDEQALAKHAKATFACSIVYLFGLFLGLVLDHALLAPLNFPFIPPLTPSSVLPR